MENQTKEEYVEQSMRNLLLDIGQNPDTFRSDKPQNDYIYRSMAAGMEQAYDLLQERDKELEAQYQDFLRSNGFTE